MRSTFAGLLVAALLTACAEDESGQGDTSQAATVKPTADECVGYFIAEARADCADDREPVDPGYVVDNNGLVQAPVDPDGQGLGNAPQPAPKKEKKCDKPARKTAALAAATPGLQACFAQAKVAGQAIGCAGALALACPPEVEGDVCTTAKATAQAMCDFCHPQGEQSPLRNHDSRKPSVQ